MNRNVLIPVFAFVFILIQQVSVSAENRIAVLEQGSARYWITGCDKWNNKDCTEKKCDKKKKKKGKACCMNSVKAEMNSGIAEKKCGSGASSAASSESKKGCCHRHSETPAEKKAEPVEK